MKVFITGTSGVGKTTLIDELARRSYVAFNTDDIPGATRLEIKATGQAVEWPTGYVDWQKYAWNWQDAKLKELLSSADLVFIGAIVGNWTVYASLFDKIFVFLLPCLFCCIGSIGWLYFLRQQSRATKKL